MAYTREQLGQRARETLKKLLGALEGERLVPRFVDSYVIGFDRPGLKASPNRYRELLSTIGRECLLAMVAKMNAALPGHLTRRRLGILRGVDAEAAAAFREEFFTILSKTLNWSAGDSEEFRRDLNLYVQLAARAPKPMKPRKPTDPAEGPFVDRCALLLDPSLLDKARHAAGKLLVELDRVIEKILDNVFDPKRKD